MKQAQKTLKSITGVETHLIRTPYGSKPSLTEAQKKVLKKNGFIYWDWNIDSLDWKYRSQKFVPEVMNQLNILEAADKTADRDPDARYSFNGSIIAVIADKFKKHGVFICNT